MMMRALRASAFAGLLTAGCFVSSASAQAQAAAQPPTPRLALVIGEAAYNGDALPTAGNDAALVAQTLGAEGFDVTELHDLNTPDLASKYQAFLAKVAAAPSGAAVTVYLAGLGVAVGCDDYLLPVDAQIRAESDVPRIALGMTQVMNDLAQTSSQLRLVMLDGARPIPPSVSAVELPARLDPARPARRDDLRALRRNPRPRVAAETRRRQRRLRLGLRPRRAAAADRRRDRHASGARRRPSGDRRRADAMAGDEYRHAAFHLPAQRRPGADADGRRELAEFDRAALRPRRRERLLGRHLAQFDPRLSSLSRGVLRQRDRRSSGARHPVARPAAAAQSTVSGDGRAAAARASHGGPGLPGWVRSARRLQRRLLRSAGAAAGAGVPGRVLDDRHRRRHGLQPVDSAARADLSAFLPRLRRAPLLLARQAAAVLSAGVPSDPA